MVDGRDDARLPPVGDNRPATVLRRHGRSFHFASHFLPGRLRRRATRLYAFCRWVDDLVDEGCGPGDHDASELLDQIARDLAARSTTLPRLADFMDLARTTGIPMAAPRHLLDGLRLDQGRVAIADEDALRRYAYRVAGSVGVMMARVLDLADRRGLAHAIDLGVAMQFTNIARDVAEDARRQRRYLPATWFEPAVVPELASNLDRHEPAIRQATRRLLAMAEPYYASGEDGLCLLPPGARPGIRIAARVYRHIGVMIERQDCSPLAPRASVPTWRKVAIALRSLAVPPGWRRSRRDPAKAHDPALHAGFQDLVAEVMADRA